MTHLTRILRDVLRALPIKTAPYAFFSWFPPFARENGGPNHLRVRFMGRRIIFRRRIEARDEKNGKQTKACCSNIIGGCRIRGVVYLLFLWSNRSKNISNISSFLLVFELC